MRLHAVEFIHGVGARNHSRLQVRAREHIVQGMLQALGMIDAVIELVRAR